MKLHIGINAPIGAGKSTLAQMLSSEFDKLRVPNEIISFAAPIKYLVDHLTDDTKHNYDFALGVFYNWGVRDKLLSDVALAVTTARELLYDRTPGAKQRKLYQYVGTEVGRMMIDEHFWINLLRKSARSDTVVISDDVRFNNEALAVDVLIGIDITANEALYEERKKIFDPSYFYTKHISERGIDIPYAYIVPVGFTVDDVKSLAQRIYRHDYSY